MSKEDNIQLVKDSLDAINAHDIDRFLETIHENYTWSLDPFTEPMSGHDALRAYVETGIATFPDLNYELTKILGDDEDTVVIRLIVTGTHEGEFMGVAPTHKKIEVHVCVFSEIKEGKRYKMLQYTMGPGIPEQLGAS